MTCYIATADRMFADELKSLAFLSDLQVTTAVGDLLLLDMDMPAPAPICRKIIRFSRNADAEADLTRPFSYQAFFALVQLQSREDASGGLGGFFWANESFTATEKRLLDALMCSNGETISSQSLAKDVFGDAACQNELKVYIRHLRKKIEEPYGIRVIETVRGAGYRFRHDRVLQRHSDPVRETNHGR
ncbi:MAG: winged-helix domain-containing protein [Ruminococcaceae bacterium]|nr:winged-helix domain-containing protein [Oscillospiraceae bacterium]